MSVIPFINTHLSPQRGRLVLKCFQSRLHHNFQKYREQQNTKHKMQLWTVTVGGCIIKKCKATSEFSSEITYCFWNLVFPQTIPPDIRYIPELLTGGGGFFGFCKGKKSQIKEHILYGRQTYLCFALHTVMSTLFTCWFQNISQRR